MKKRTKLEIKRLRYPLWSQIVFFLLTVIVPLVLVMVEGYKSPSTGFKWTFGIISGLVVVWSFVHKFVLSKWEDKWRDRQVKLEHDYEIDVGNTKKIKWLWFDNEMKLNICVAIKVALWGSLLAVVITAIAKGLMLIKGAIIAIAICYVVAYVLKFLIITIQKGTDVYEDDEQ